MIALAYAGQVDVIAKGTVDGHARGWVYVGGGMWEPDRASEGPITTAALIAPMIDRAGAARLGCRVFGSNYFLFDKVEALCSRPQFPVPGNAQLPYGLAGALPRAVLLVFFGAA